MQEIKATSMAVGCTSAGNPLFHSISGRDWGEWSIRLVDGWVQREIDRMGMVHLLRASGWGNADQWAMQSHPVQWLRLSNLYSNKLYFGSHRKRICVIPNEEEMERSWIGLARRGKKALKTINWWQRSLFVCAHGGFDLWWWVWWCQRLWQSSSQLTTNLHPLAEETSG